MDPTNFNATGYIELGGNNVNSTKGYICPLGQVCRVRYSQTSWISVLRLISTFTGERQPL